MNAAVILATLIIQAGNGPATVIDYTTDAACKEVVCAINNKRSCSEQAEYEAKEKRERDEWQAKNCTKSRDGMVSMCPGATWGGFASTNMSYAIAFPEPRARCLKP